MKKITEIKLTADGRKRLEAARDELKAASDVRAAAEARVEEVQRKLDTVEMRLEI